jgi:hypothetical protein
MQENIDVDQVMLEATKLGHCDGKSSLFRLRYA